MTELARELHAFRGGVEVAACKAALQQRATRRLPLAERLILPLQQHVGVPAEPVVAVGQRVARNELLACAPEYVGMTLHAPSAGTVEAIDDRAVIHPGGVRGAALVLRTASGDEPESPSDDDAATLDSAAIIARVAAAGIVGLGGAGFPTHVKLGEGATRPVDLLIVNAVECEPRITCDDRLLQERSNDVAAGARIAMRCLDARDCVIAVENDMPAAHAAMSAVACDDMSVVSVPSVYPAGSEKQLIQMLTGREVPSGLLPIHIGVVVLNAQTVAAIYRAVTMREPLTRRLVTVAGDFAAAGTYDIPIGTPVRHVLDALDIQLSPRHIVLAGGPMMGTRIHDLASPVTKTVNCLLVTESLDTSAARACIRCGDCIPVCPVGLQPQQLFESARKADLDEVQDYHLFDCIECGCCAYVCPSHIPLVQYYRSAKSAIEALDDDRARADAARALHAARLERAGRQPAADPGAAVVLADMPAGDPEHLRDDVLAAVARAARKRSDEDAR